MLYLLLFHPLSEACYFISKRRLHCLLSEETNSSMHALNFLQSYCHQIHSQTAKFHEIAFKTKHLSHNPLQYTLGLTTTLFPHILYDHYKFSNRGSCRIHQIIPFCQILGGSKINFSGFRTSAPSFIFKSMY